jgi:hypothetical protein
LPIFIVNPARKAAKKRTPAKGSIRRVPTSKGAKKPSKRKTAARKTAITNPQGKKKMAIKRRRQTAAQKRAAAAARRRRGRTRNPKKDPKKVAAGKKGAAAKKRKAQAARYHSGAAAYGKGASKRKYKKPAKKRKKAAAKKRTSKRSKASYRAAGLKAARTRKRNLKGTSKRKLPTRRKAKRDRKQAARYSSYGLKTVKRARKRVLAAKKRKGAWRTRKFLGRHNMLKINPSNGMMSAVKQVLPIAGSFYVSRLTVNKLSEVTAVGDVIGKVPLNLGKPVLSGVIMAVTHYGTKKGALAKHRTGLMLGTALAFVDSLVAALAPKDVKAMMGIKADGEEKKEALSQYVSSGEYVAQSEYVGVGEYVSMGDHQHAYGTSIGPGDFRQEHGASLFADPHGLYAVDGLHEIHAIHGIDQELGAIEAGVDTGANSGIFSNGW